MTREEARLTLQENLGYLTSIHHQRILDAIKVAIEVLSESSLPSNLDEAAEEYAIQGHENHTNINYINTYIEGKRIGFKAGAKWIAGQGVCIPAHIFMPCEIKDVYDSSKGEYPAAIHPDCGGSLVLERYLKDFKHNEEVIMQIRKKDE